VTTSYPARILERRSYPGLLGIRFWDVGAGAQVRDHELEVRARSPEGKVVDAKVNRSGVWFYPDLPGVSSALVDELFGQGSPPSSLGRRFRVSVAEPILRRRTFQPIEFDVDAPVDGGLYDWPFGGTETGAGSPPPSGYVPLFSLASRVTPTGRLVVRAELWDTRERPAAFALLEITCDGPSGQETFVGLADAKGAVAVFLPVPFVPLGAPKTPAALRTWMVGVRVSYAPSLTVDRSPPADAPLTLDTILAQRGTAPARAFAARDPDRLLVSATLGLSESLALTTVGLPPEAAGRLLVEPSP
jgi:hypothetical protein